MKKVLTTTVLAALTLGVAAPAFAATPNDINVSGDFRYRWTNDRQADFGDVNDYRLRVELRKEVDENLTLKARYAAEGEFGNNVDNISSPTQDGKFDQISLKYTFKDGKSAVVAGKDNLFLGTGLLADFDSFDGVQLTSTFGAVNAKAAIAMGKNTGTNSGDKNKGYAVSAQTKLGATDFGATYFDTKTGLAKNWAVNAGYTINQVNLAGEYTKNIDHKTKAYSIKATIGELAKKGDTNYSISYNRIEANSINPDFTTLDMNWFTEDSNLPNGIKGYSIDINHQLGKNTTLTLQQQFANDLLDNSNRNRTRIELNTSF